MQFSVSKTMRVFTRKVSLSLSLFHQDKKVILHPGDIFKVPDTYFQVAFQKGWIPLNSYQQYVKSIHWHDAAYENHSYASNGGK